MAHYALVDENNVVVQVITGRNEDEIVEEVSDWEAHYSEVTGYNAIQTSYNTLGGVHYGVDEDGNRIPSKDQTKALRKNYAGIGYTYDEERDAFIPPKPFESWVLNEDSCLWESPVPYPTDGERYVWDEESGAWVEVEDDTV
jgi:hypothetical protein